MNWIKTTDMLPPDHEHVLIWYLRAGVDNKPGVYIGYYIESLDEFRAIGAMGDCRDFITHWMPMPGDPKFVDHCRQDFTKFEKMITCCKCAAPLADNQLVKDAYKMNTVNVWAKSQLRILADIAESRGMQWFADEARKIACSMLNLN